VWDATLAPEAMTFPGQSHDFRYVNLAFAAENDRLLWAASDGTARAWDTTLGQQVSASREATHVEAVFSSDGKRVAVGCEDGSVQVLDALTPPTPPSQGWEGGAVAASPLFRLKLPKGASRPLAFRADGTRLATIDEDGVISISDISTGQTTPCAKLPLFKVRFDRMARRQIGFSPDLTKVVLAASGGPYQIWDVETGQAVASLGVNPAEDLPGLFVFSADGTRLAGRIGAAEIAIWDVATGERQVVLEGHYHLVMCLVFSPDGTRLASAGWDRTVKVWDTETGHEAITFRGHSRAVTGLAFSADGMRLAAASFDGTVHVFDARPWTPESPAEREALGLVHFYFARPLCREDVLMYLRHFPVTHPEARDKALALAQRFRESADPQVFHEAAWAIVRQPFSNPFQYGLALKQAETARRLAPAENRYRTTLGLAQYRAGNYAEAVTTLTEADKLQKDVPANLAFLALSHLRLGQEEQAKSALARLQETLKKLDGPAKEEAMAFLREAEAHIPLSPAVNKP
jgi:WD40 repeat protein